MKLRCGSILLDFTSNALGTDGGVYGVALDFLMNYTAPPTNGWITFGDGSGAPISASSFSAITSSALIATIHFSAYYPNGDTSGVFVIDNLTIAAAPVDEPSTWALVVLALFLTAVRAKAGRLAVATANTQSLP